MFYLGSVQEDTRFPCFVYEGICIAYTSECILCLTMIIGQWQCKSIVILSDTQGLMINAVLVQ